MPNATQSNTNSFSIIIDVRSGGGKVHGDMVVAGIISDVEHLAQAHVIAIQVALQSAKVISEGGQLTEQHRLQFREAFVRFVREVIAEQEEMLSA
mgnify:CR=1 FL=1